MDPMGVKVPNARLTIYIMHDLYNCFMNVDSPTREIRMETLEPGVQVTLKVYYKTVEIEQIHTGTGRGRGWKFITSSPPFPSPNPRILLFILDQYAMKLPSTRQEMDQFGRQMDAHIGLAIGPLNKKQALQNTFQESRAPILHAMKHRSKRFTKDEKEFLSSIDNIGMVRFEPHEKIKITHQKGKKY